MHAEIEEKIQQAQDLLVRHEAQLRQDPQVRDLLERLSHQIQASMEVMQALGVVAACRTCEELEGGSCCGVGIENRYSVTLLVINLLLGAVLPGELLLIDSCYFLGEKGCSLKARHVLCVNYLCAKIQRNLDKPDLIKLQTIVGEELETGFRLYEIIRKIITP